MADYRETQSARGEFDERADRLREVAGTLHAALEYREAQAQAEWDQAAQEFAAVYQQGTAHEAPVSDPEQWHTQVEASAHAVLSRAADLTQRSPLHQVGVDAAAVAYVYTIVETSRIESMEEATITQLLSDSGVNPDELREGFKEEFSKQFDVDPNAISETFATFTGMARCWGEDPAYWDAMVVADAERFCVSLQLSNA